MNRFAPTGHEELSDWHGEMSEGAISMCMCVYVYVCVCVYVHVHVHGAPCSWT